ncbi:hypothetical protein Tcan_01115, partial [Toxocara canis]
MDEVMCIRETVATVMLTSIKPLVEQKYPSPLLLHFAELESPNRLKRWKRNTTVKGTSSTCKKTFLLSGIRVQMKRQIRTHEPTNMPLQHTVRPTECTNMPINMYACINMPINQKKPIDRYFCFEEFFTLAPPKLLDDRRVLRLKENL